MPVLWLLWPGLAFHLCQDPTGQTARQRHLRWKCLQHPQSVSEPLEEVEVVVEEEEHWIKAGKVD